MQNIYLQDYSIFLDDVWEEWNNFIQKGHYSKLVVLVDENTKTYCLPLLLKNSVHQNWQVIEIPSGEQHKTLSTCELIWAALMDADIDRKALMVNLGGGVIGDMGGFCASTYKRGIDFVQFPTTLLAQVDASIGGKLGIDFHKVKNSIGVFKNPKAVFIFTDFLQTLSARELRSGFAEIIKHSLIADTAEWERVKSISLLEKTDWMKFIYSSLLVKQRIVEFDPFEKGLRKALNFGHTVGHAVESYFLETNSPLLHGEAIAIGMIAETYLSHRQAELSTKQLQEVTSYLLQLYGGVPVPTHVYEDLLGLMAKDKKNEYQQINFSLIQPIGSVHVNKIADKQAIIESLNYYNQMVKAITD
ncbi:MAG: 3-dehydroquinate synthase [Saprospiraceae bacterium]|nr:3-dehydroquinate synthase [Saprospiraceae bacterium]